MSEISDNDTEIIAKLRRGLEQTDPVPENVSEFARALWSWRDIDAELVELSFDSADEPTPSGVRSSGTSRIVSFETGDLELDIEYHPDTAVLMGQLSTQQNFPVELHVDGARFASQADELGRFEFEDVRGGPVSLVLSLADGRVVKTTWINL